MITENEAIEDIEKALESGVPDGLRKETLLLANMALKKQISANPIKIRLIDADKLKLCYTGTNGLDDKAEYFSIRKMIDLQPTAYDVDKVVERLMCESINCHIMTDRAVEIIKSGGIE